MFEIGQIFKKNGCEYCVLDIIHLDNKEYILFSKETDKLSYVFYEVQYIDEKYLLVEVVDEKLNFTLLNIFEGKEI